MSRVVSNKGLGLNAKKCLNESVVVTTAVYGVKAWGMRSAGRR